MKEASELHIRSLQSAPSALRILEDKRDIRIDPKTLKSMLQRKREKFMANEKDAMGFLGRLKDMKDKNPGVWFSHKMDLERRLTRAAFRPPSVGSKLQGEWLSSLLDGRQSPCNVVSDAHHNYCRKRPRRIAAAAFHCNCCG